MNILAVILLMTNLMASELFGDDDLLKRRGSLIPPQNVYELENLNKVLFSELRLQNKDLKKVKYHLVNGEVRLAKIHLNKLAYTETKLRPIILRYLAILYFIEGNYEKAYFYLSKIELQKSPMFSKICTLKVITQIALSKTLELDETWIRCQKENFNDFKGRNLVWLETLIQLKLSPGKETTKIPFKRVKLASLDNTELKLIMKLALYLNQENLLIDQIPELTVSQLEDEEVREIIGHTFYRTGSLSKSYRFIEDLKSPNAENVKGNLYLLRKKYELAYAQYKLALEQKQNSQNALERILPLAWLLGDWEGGSKFAESANFSAKTKINKLTLTAAFNMQRGDYIASDKILESIANNSRRGSQLEVTQLASFTSLMQNNPEKTMKKAKMSCEQYDLANCWVLFQLTQWDNFPLTIRRDEKISKKNTWEELIKEEYNDPIKETTYINQLDIEEMDDKLIQLIPTP